MNGKMQFLLYNMPDDKGNVQVVVKGETLWCTPKAMSQLFGVGVSAISKYLSNIYEDGELAMDTTISQKETVVNLSGIRSTSKD